jgi:small subunit ribosomal protein S1
VSEFRIIEYGEGGRNLVVSRRALLEEEQQARAAEVKRTIVVGAVLTGRVASVRDFGAFVDLGGNVQGLLHVSEMAWSRVAAPADVVKTGDEITVKVLRVDDDLKKISLGLRQLTADPWAKVPETYEVGQTRVGRVTRVADFGAFVELEPGIEALAHESTFAPTGQPGNWSTSVTPGTTGVFEILNIDLERKRIGVALVLKGETPAGTVASSSAAIVPGARLKGKVERLERFGVFVFLAPGRTGLIPMRETGVSEADVRKSFPVGAEVEVVVLEVDAAGRRIRLSAKAVMDSKEADEVREYQERAGGPPTGGLGSLADKLRGALGTRKG